MNSKITYQRAGNVRHAYISSRLVPNAVAVKFVVVEQELAEDEEIASLDDHLFLDELLERMDIVILDVSPTEDSVPPKPYTTEQGSRVSP